MNHKNVRNPSPAVYLAMVGFSVKKNEGVLD